VVRHILNSAGLLLLLTALWACSESQLDKDVEQKAVLPSKEGGGVQRRLTEADDMRKILSGMRSQFKTAVGFDSRKAEHYELSKDLDICNSGVLQASGWDEQTCLSKIGTYYTIEESVVGRKWGTFTQGEALLWCYVNGNKWIGIDVEGLIVEESNLKE
jgi:hypothetical protein